MKKILTLIILLTLFGCKMPSTTVRTVDAQPGIAIKGAPATAELRVDNISYGPVVKFDGNPGFLAISPGNHKVTIIDGGQILYEQTIIVDDALKVVNIR